jgi:hypothetical protein
MSNQATPPSFLACIPHAIESQWDIRAWLDSRQYCLCSKDRGCSAGPSNVRFRSRYFLFGRAG